jgi:hypothetical protein
MEGVSVQVSVFGPEPEGLPGFQVSGFGFQHQTRRNFNSIIADT